jgi:YidC/Oxa1 family membrane protein insertase
MEKRLLFFLLSAGLVLVLWGRLFPPPPPPPAEEVSAPVDPARPTPPPTAVDPGLPVLEAPALDAPVFDAPRADVPAREVVVRSGLYEYRLSTHGAGFTHAALPRYESYVRRGEQVQLVPESEIPVLSRRLVVGADTVDLTRMAFEPSAEALEVTEETGPQELRFTSTGGGLAVEVVYTFLPDDYRVGVAGRIEGAPVGTLLLSELGNGLEPHDAREHGSERELAAVGWDTNRIQRLQLRKVRGTDSIPGPLIWAGIKDRYFLIALINEDAAGRFTHVASEQAPDARYADNGDHRMVPRARTFAASPLAADGTFRFEAYLGPQEHGRLAAVGHELQEVNPYGYRWLRPVIRPIAAAILWLLNELHHNLGIAYGWVLVIFGVLMRIVTWPLNARAMRSQMKNMAVQPLLQKRMKEIQAQYKNDPKGQQEAILAMYRELGVNPFSMMSGCLPMLIPMPVLITLFFVFQSAIEFRGTSFAWLADLSLRDPYYILPIFLVVSMFGLQWVSTKLSGMDQNPQMKMMMYMMPVMMGIIFWIMPAGLNLYYASTNVASFPQQILIARERKKATLEQEAKDAAKAKETKVAARPRGGTHRVKRTRKKG